MATELAKAYIQLVPSAQGMKGNIEKIMNAEGEGAGKSAGGKFSAAFGGAIKVGIAGVAAGVTASFGAAVAAGKELVSNVASLAEYGDNIDKMSQKMGLSVEAYQEWDAIMQHSGTSIEAMQSSMKTLANAVERDNEAFKRLGITESDIASMNNEELFAATITALQGVENETERTYLAGQVLGRGATELGALLNTSAEDTEAMRQRVHELGGVMSEEAVKSAAAYQDSLQDMKTAFSGLSRGLLAEFMPDITIVMDGLREIFAGNSENGIAIVSDGVQKVIDDITTMLPQFIDLGSGILEAISKAIIANLPKILEAGGKLVGELVAGIVKLIPVLVTQGPELVKAVIRGLIAAWPDIKQAGIDLIKVLIDTIKPYIDAAKTWGRDLIANFIQGIKDKIGALKSTVSNIAQTVKSFIGFSEPEQGPLSDFHTFAPDMMELFAEGIHDNLGLIRAAVGDAAATTREELTARNAPTPGVSVAERQQSAQTGGVDAAMIAAAVREALRDMGVYMDGRRVGSLVTASQSNTARAFG